MRVSKPSPSGDDEVLHNQIMLMMFTSLQKDVFSIGIPPHKLNSEHLLLLEQFNSIIRGFHEPNSDVHAQHLGVVYDGIVQNQALSAFGDCKVTSPMSNFLFLFSLTLFTSPLTHMLSVSLSLSLSLSLALSFSFSSPSFELEPPQQLFR
jgi:hypothetical protein